MEYDNDDHIWRRPSSHKAVRTSGCRPYTRRSTTAAVTVLGLAVLSCLLGYCVLSETLPYESKTLRMVVIVSTNSFLDYNEQGHCIDHSVDSIYWLLISGQQTLLLYFERE